MDEHKKVCPFEVIQCGAMITRNEMDLHNIEKMTEHMQLTFKDTTTTVFNELYTMKLGLCIIICLHIKMLKDG